jgi:DNA-binding transcriptional MerR regulator
VSEVLRPIEAAPAVGGAGETLRYRERAGLLVPVARDAAGRRRYSTGDRRNAVVERIRAQQDELAVVEEIAAYEEIA